METTRDITAEHLQLYLNQNLIYLKLKGLFEGPFVYDKT
jgi:hypothetical protein